MSDKLREAARAAWPSDPVERALMEAGQQESFVRGQLMDRDPVVLGPAQVLAAEVRRLRAALAAETDETVRVPKKMNNAQRRAIIQACDDHVALFPHDGILRADRIYNAMLAAAKEGKS